MIRRISHLFSKTEDKYHAISFFLVTNYWHHFQKEPLIIYSFWAAVVFWVSEEFIVIKHLSWDGEALVYLSLRIIRIIISSCCAHWNTVTIVTFDFVDASSALSLCWWFLFYLNSLAKGFPSDSFVTNFTGVVTEVESSSHMGGWGTSVFFPRSSCFAAVEVSF